MNFQAKLMTVIVDASRRCMIQILIRNCQIFPVEGRRESCPFSLLPLLRSMSLLLMTTPLLKSLLLMVFSTACGIPAAPILNDMTWFQKGNERYQQQDARGDILMRKEK
jgi:hypothetical protein